MTAIDDVFRPWLDCLLEETGPLELFDAHTHIGRNDPDGFKQTPDELVEGLAAADARGVVFPMHEPTGYGRRTTRRSPRRRTTPAGSSPSAASTRTTGRWPRRARCLDAGARGIKLHPRAEQFGMDAPAVRDIVALAHERARPDADPCRPGDPGARPRTVDSPGVPRRALILAHAGDLRSRVAVARAARASERADRHRVVEPSDLLALFALAPPASLVWASDSPYGRPLVAAAFNLRCALQAGITPEQLAGSPAGRSRGCSPATCRMTSAPRRGRRPSRSTCSSSASSPTSARAIGRMAGGGDPVEPLGLARLACAVGTDSPQAELFGAILELLDEYEAGVDEGPLRRPFPPAVRFLVAAHHRRPHARRPAPAPARRASAHAGGGRGLAVRRPAKSGRLACDGWSCETARRR